MGFPNLNTASNIVIALEHADGREINMRGLKTRDKLFTLSNYEENDAFVANRVDVPFNRIGLDYTFKEINDWAVANGFTLIMEGVSPGPKVQSFELDGPKTGLTITFDENIDLAADDNAALKALITIATDGSNYAALAGGDAVSTPDGSGATLVITFDAALTTATNLIKIGSGAVNNADGVENAEQIVGPVDAS